MRHNIILQPSALLFIMILAVGSVFSNSADAQSIKDEADVYQTMFGAEKKELMKSFLNIEDDDPFWTVYDEYETERKELGLKRIELLKDYSDNYLTLDDAKTDEIVKESIKQQKALNALIDKYYKKVRKASGSKKAAQFYHFENDLLNAVRLKILDNIPAIGAFDI